MSIQVLTIPFVESRVRSWVHHLLNSISGGGDSAIFAVASRSLSSAPSGAPSSASSAAAPADVSIEADGKTSPSDASPPTLETLYRRYSGSIYWVCLRHVKNREDAEDLVNQVFVKVQRHLGTFQGQSGIYTWIYRIAVNECIQLYRRRKFEVDGFGDDALEERLPTFPERQILAKMTLDKLMRRTDAQTTEIVFLLYLEGLTQEEVVEKLGISRTTLNRKLTTFKTLAEPYR